MGFHACKCESGWGGLDCSKVKVAAGSGSGKKSGAGSGSSSGGLAGGSSGVGSAAMASGSVASSSTASGSGSVSVPSTSGSTSSSSSASTSSSASSTSSESGGGSASIFSATSKSAAAPQGTLQATFRKLRGALIDPHEFADVAEDSAKAALVAPEEAEKSESDSDSDSFSMSGSGSQEPPPPPPTKKTTCPGDCNKHGKCKNSKCYCEAGFTTDDCSVSVEDYEKSIDPGALVEKDLLGMFIACFVGGCVFVGVIQCGTWCWARAKKKLRNEPDSDSDE